MFNIDEFIDACESMKINDYYVDPPHFGNIIGGSYESSGHKFNIIKVIMEFIQGILDKFRLWKKNRRIKKGEKHHNDKDNAFQDVDDMYQDVVVNGRSSDPKLTSLASKFRNCMSEFVKVVDSYKPGDSIDERTLSTIDNYEKQMGEYIKEMKGLKTDATKDAWEEILNDIIAASNYIETVLIRLNLSLKKYENYANGATDSGSAEYMKSMNELKKK